MKHHYMFADKNINIDDKSGKNDVKISDIINMGKDISGDWLKIEAEKKTIIQEHLQRQKGKAKKNIP